MRFKELFSKDPCNTGRQFEIDLMKLVLIVRLAPVHVIVEATRPELLDVLGLPYYFDSVVGGLIGPTRFMILMGLGLAYTRHGTPREVFMRGVKIGIIGVILNICRYLIPSLIGYGLSGNYDKYILNLPYLFFSNDILQFASLAMMLMALLLYFKLNPQKIFAVSLVMSLAGNLLRQVDTHSNVLNVILSHFIGVESKGGAPFIYSDFPLIIWFIFYAFGYLFTYYYKRLNNKARFFAVVSPVCLVIAAAFTVWEIIGGFGMMMGEGVNVFYHMTTPEAFICILAFIGTLGIFYPVSKIIPEKLKKPIESISRNVNSVYCIHWVIVWWTVDLFIYLIRGNQYLEPQVAVAIGAVITVVSIVIADLWSKFKYRRKDLHEKRG